MSRKLLEVAADLVQAQVSTNAMTSEEMISSLKSVFNTLQAMQKSETEGTFLDIARELGESWNGERAHAVDPKNSIQEDRIICLECSAEMKQLTAKHLDSHALSPREYKQKWGFPLKQPLSAKSLTRERSKAAKERGLPAELKEFQEKKKREKEMLTAGEMNPEPEMDEKRPETKVESKRSRKKKSE